MDNSAPVGQVSSAESATTNTPVVSTSANGVSPKQVDNKNLISTRIDKLAESIEAAKLPEDLHEKCRAMVERLRLISGEASFFTEFDNISRYVTWLINIPWGKVSEDVLDLNHARQVLEKNHYGLTQVKESILEYLSVMVKQRQAGIESHEVLARAPIISLVGLAGVGKTTIAYSIAEALGRKIERIPFGGMGSAGILRGQSRFSPEAEPGAVVKAIARAGTMNPVILLDEVDRVSDNARGDIMGVLVELLDPEQNRAYTDHYIDYPVNLSNVLFIATSNNTKDISTAVLDRLEIVQMPSYNDDEKITIAKKYLLPNVLKESGLKDGDVIIPDDIWAGLVRPLGFDPGIRSLQRLVRGLVRRVVLFELEGKIPAGKQFQVTAENVKMLVSVW